MLAKLLLTLALVEAVRACECQLINQTYSNVSGPKNWPQFWIQNAFDGSVSCPQKCSLLFYSGNDTMGVGNYSPVQWDDALTGTISIYNSDANWTQGTVIKEDIDKSTPSLPNLASTGPYVLVVVDLTSQGYLLATMGPMTQATITTTPVSVVPTTPLAGPARISHDMLIMVDAGQTNNPADFTASKQWAASVVDIISPAVLTGVAVPDANGDAYVTGTRLSLNSLNFINFSPITTPWLDNATDVAQSIRNLNALPSKKTNFFNALSPLINTADSIFNIYSDPNIDYSSRRTAQRTLLLVASSLPQAADLTNVAGLNFALLDIHPIFIAFNFNSTDFTNLASALTSWTVVAYNDPSTAGDFVSSYLQDGSGNTFCKQLSLTSYTTNSTSQTITFPTGFTMPTTWKPNNQISRYCNFQKISYTVAKSTNTGKQTCFTVSYETEVEKDTIKFYQKDATGSYKEVVSLSGVDVSGSTFRFDSDTRIDFETNESQVFGGFSISFIECPN